MPLAIKEASHLLLLLFCKRTILGKKMWWLRTLCQSFSPLISFFPFFSLPQYSQRIIHCSLEITYLQPICTAAWTRWPSGPQFLILETKRMESISPQDLIKFISHDSVILEHKNSSGANSCLLESFPTAQHLWQVVTSSAETFSILGTCCQAASSIQSSSDY